MTTDLDTLVEQTMSKYREYEEKKQKKAKEERRQKEEQTERALLLLLEEHLSPDFLASVGMRFDHSYDSYYGHSVTAYFRYMGVNWQLEYERSHWSIRVAEPGKSYGTQKASGLTHESLQAMLLVEMGKYREAMQKQQEASAEHERKQAEWQREQARVKAENERERKARIAEAEAMHGRLLEYVAEERRKAEENLWHWPEGVTVEIYELQYCTGGYRDEDGSLSCDYSTGWTDVASLGELGRITLQPQKRYSWRDDAESPRVVQLVMDVHMPVWEVHRYSSIEELPETLREKVIVSFPHIVERRNADLYEDRLVETTDTDYDGNWYTETIGEVPLPWIRALVEKNAAKFPSRNFS